MFSVPSTSSLFGASLHSRISFTHSTPSPSCVRFRPPRVIASASTSSNCLCPPKPTASFYQVLGIPMGATPHEIKAAYRRLTRICHPDAAAEDRKDSSADEFMKIHAAYSTLSDPEKRAVYDQKLFHLSFVSYSGISASPATATAGFSGYPRRNWETDQCW
ncbi:chaperone protein dnaJ 11, chloroplastic-like [Cornus florida]|uniref:chaperone protein dnaJ 11, chloroplastic-like n=1 Tax=Cornus florida TaxID=4283 RepID=UPI0028A21CCE|nr:chaperone protein dnaJ 11, chloroplastic-like [Cornus florida]